MVDETGPNSTPKPDIEPAPQGEASVPPASRPGTLRPMSLRHEKPVIDGEIVAEATPAAETAATAAAEAPPADAAAPENADENAPSTAEGAAAAAEPDTSKSAQAHGAIPPRRPSLWPIAAAIVVGAGLAVGGAWALRNFDQAPDQVAALAAQNDKLSERLAALEKRPDAGAAPHEDVDAQDKRLTALENSVRDALSTAKSALGTAEAAKSTEPSASPGETVDLGPLTARLADLEHRVGDLDQKLAELSAPKADVRLPEAKAVEPAPGSEAEAKAVIAASLIAKIDHGLSYAPELAALSARGVSSSELAPLETNAATGVATPQALAAQFAALAESLNLPEPAKREAEAPQAEPQAEGGSFFDHLLDSAARLVRVRKIAPASDEAAAGPVPRQIAGIKAALAQGSLDTALAGWNDLPATAKAKSQSFADALKQRLDALAAARAIQAEAIAALGKAKS